jgi:hypothetical protein
MVKISICIPKVIVLGKKKGSSHISSVHSAKNQWASSDREHGAVGDEEGLS